MKKSLLAAIGGLLVVGVGAASIGFFSGGSSAFDPAGSDPVKTINKLLKHVSIEKGTAISMPLSGEESAALHEILPDLPEEYVVEGDGDIDLLVWSSPEKAGSDTESWLKDLCEQFNDAGYMLGDQQISVTLRSISSGLANDYIASGKEIPDLYTPSSSIWKNILESQSVSMETLQNKLLGNCAGLFIHKDVQQKLFGDQQITLEKVVKAVENGEAAMGYTNPYTSTTGLNFLASLENAGVDFENFQSHIPYVATTSSQMVSSAQKGTFGIFVGESQQYAANPLFQKNYVFIPFGTRHDNPLYAINLSDEKAQAARIFADTLISDQATASGKEKFFFAHEDYMGDPTISGSDYLAIQESWKKEKDSGKTVVSFFVADTSGSMDGYPLKSLQDSLMKTMQEINEDAWIGLISYSSSVVVEMPLTKFDINAKAQFKGAVYDLEAAGNTYTYEALCVALRELDTFKKEHPELNVAPKIILLSDGEANGDLMLDHVRDIVTDMKIPVYTVGYNYRNGSLEELSDLSESASLNADEQDVITKLRDLFRINL